jgi:hypothetical protein
MKKLIITTILIISSIVIFAQTTTVPPVQNISTDSAVVYRLFATRNTYNFIKLNTRNGKMTLVQWSTESNERFEYTLSDIAQVSSDKEKNRKVFSLSYFKYIYVYFT